MENKSGQLGKLRDSNRCTECGSLETVLITEWKFLGTYIIPPEEELCRDCAAKRGFNELPESLIRKNIEDTLNVYRPEN